MGELLMTCAASGWAGLARSEFDMERLGGLLAEALPAQARGALRAHLHGELGAGKTTLARGLLRALGVAGAVRSPSYALIELHETATWRVLHIDLYRLADPEDVMALGLADFDAPDCLWLVEWPERAGDALPPPDLQIRLGVQAGGHPVEIRAGTLAGEAWLSGFRNSAQVSNFS
jgi:tRNA threonylcarbamoyladenosine biosynthesis protein TsaE